MLSFKKWLKEQSVIGSDMVIRTINDILADDSFPESVCKFTMLDYLKKNANDDVIAIFNDFYEQYINYITQDDPPVD